MGKPRLPWKRGPAAWEIVSRADEVRSRITACPKSFVSLRRAARLLGVSTQPLRDWIRLGHLKREGPRQQIGKGELERLVDWLCARAKPFAAENYTARFFRKRKRPPDRLETLSRAQFLWPTGRHTLTPPELAELIGCHPSLVTKAIHWYFGLGKRKSACRWEITRRAWQSVFRFSIIAPPRLPVLPRKPEFSVREAAALLGWWGVPKLTAYRVRQMVQSGELEAIPPAPGKRGIFITRKSLKKKQKIS